MARITHEKSEYTAKPVGVMTASIVDAAWHTNYDDLPNISWLKDKSNLAVLELMVLPKDHDREQHMFVPIKLVFNDEGELSLYESRGVLDIHRMLEDLGLNVAGFDIKGNFVNEKDELVQFDDIFEFITDEIFKAADFKIVVNVYKSEYEGKSYFRTSRFFYSNTDEGIKACEAQALKDAAYWAKRNNEDSKKDEPVKEQPKTGRRRVI